ncbi:MAG TPA: hypothetical protein VFV81_04220, partial [Verrucomicrobiae bacterium]|nr:hypothetical protein [Verrucomicrobiae bacterium]
MKRFVVALALVFSAGLIGCATHRGAGTGAVSIVVPPNAAPRVRFGAQKLVAAFKAEKIPAAITSKGGSGRCIDLNEQEGIAAEGFILTPSATGGEAILASDDSGLLYGCLELASRIQAAHGWPGAIEFRDQPAMKLRGPCIGLQKTYILPGRHVYEYPITPELFPWFYDKKLWTEYLDFLAQNRMNTLYLWSGHPFASLVRLKDYPYAVEVPPEVFAKNQAMYRWLA